MHVSRFRSKQRCGLIIYKYIYASTLFKFNIDSVAYSFYLDLPNDRMKDMHIILLLILKHFLINCALFIRFFFLQFIRYFCLHYYIWRVAMYIWMVKMPMFCANIIIILTLILPFALCCRRNCLFCVKFSLSLRKRQSRNWDKKKNLAWSLLIISLLTNESLCMVCFVFEWNCEILLHFVNFCTESVLSGLQCARVYVCIMSVLRRVSLAFCSFTLGRSLDLVVFY